MYTYIYIHIYIFILIYIYKYTYIENRIKNASVSSIYMYIYIYIYVPHGNVDMVTPMNGPCTYPCTYYIYNFPSNTAFVILGCTWIALRMPSETRWNCFFPTAS